MSTAEFYGSRKSESIWVVAGLIVLFTFLAYSNSLNGPLVFDDSASIEANSTIRDLGDWGKLISPPANGATVTGRPLLNVSLALNYAVSGINVRSYHLTNLAIHLTAALLLLGILWRTWLSAPLQNQFGEVAVPLAGVVVLLWSLHPLQTESVSYIIQRAESLAGAFYLLVFYAFIRGATETSKAWFGVAIVAGFLGVATKEIVVTAPLLLLIYDRLFLAGSWPEVWRERKWIHGGIASCWILQAVLWSANGWNRGGTMGALGDGSITSFALSQGAAVVHYLRLALWPRPLIFDYGFPVVVSWSDAWLEVMIFFALISATVWSLRKHPALGFAGLWFFIILAPTSLIPGAMQGMAEHRVYLSLAAVMGIVAALAYRLFGRRALVALAIVAVGLGGLTFQRNRDYQARTSLWADTVKKRPRNARAQDNLGRALVQEKKLTEAVPYFAAAVRLKPDYAPAHRNLGRALAEQGDLPGAVIQLEKAVQLEPDNGDYHHYLGDAFLESGRMDAAAKQYAQALRSAPDLAEEQEIRFGDALLDQGKSAEALIFFQRALEVHPRSVAALNNVGRALVKTGQPRKAAEFHFKALQIKPGDAETTFYLGNAFLAAGSLNEAATAFRNTLKLDAQFAEAHVNLGVVLSRLGRWPEAESEFRAALKIDPHSTAALNNLTRIRGR